MSSVEILSPPFRLTWTFMCSAGFSGMGSAAMFGPYELIPSGETSSYRSNPLGLAEFTLSRRDPAYVGKTKAVDALEIAREKGEDVTEKAPELKEVFKVINTIPGQENVKPQETEIGSTIYANKPGDGSAREQAASCQRVIGALANITQDYATKRYRSNVMNWGMLPCSRSMITSTCRASAPHFRTTLSMTSRLMSSRTARPPGSACTASP